MPMPRIVQPAYTNILRYFLSDNLHNILYDLLIQQTIVAEQLLQVEAVVEIFLDATNQHFHVGYAVIRGDEFTESAILRAVFKSHNKLVVCLEILQCVGIYCIQVTRVDERGIDALFEQQTSHILTLLIE